MAMQVTVASLYLVRGTHMRRGVILCSELVADCHTGHIQVASTLEACTRVAWCNIPMRTVVVSMQIAIQGACK